MFGIFKKNKAFQDLSVVEFSEKLEQGAVVIDVRSSKEYGSENIKGAQNADVLTPDFKQFIQQLDKDGAYLLYCRSGMRSAKACRIMAKEGFTDLGHLKGGIVAWARQQGL